jgi:hypothetical protein
MPTSVLRIHGDMLFRVSNGRMLRPPLMPARFYICVLSDHHQLLSASRLWYAGGTLLPVAIEFGTKVVEYLL